MESKQRLLAALRELCEEIGPDDNQLPKRKEERKSTETQDKRLAGRVGRSVSLALGACEDPELGALIVLETRPDPDARRVLLRLCRPGLHNPAEIEALHARLKAASGLLREAVAADLSRRQTPRLRFALVPDEVAP